MRGVAGKWLICWLALSLCAGGCMSRHISSVEGPLTPYSANPNAAPGTATTIDPTATADKEPYRYDPASVDPALLDKEEKPTVLERVTEAASPKKVVPKVKDFFGRGPDEAIARHNYNMGDLLFREGDYKAALKHYKIASDRWPDSPLQEDAMFMIAESYFQMDQYPRTVQMFKVMTKKYENSRYLDMIVKRRFAIGRYWERRSKEDPAIAMNFRDKSMPFWDIVGSTVNVYESIRMDDPTGPLADDATMATANTYFVHGRWEDAAYHYDLMRTEFPQSEFQAQAHLLDMQAKLRLVPGPALRRKTVARRQKARQRHPHPVRGSIAERAREHPASTEVHQRAVGRARLVSGRILRQHPSLLRGPLLLQRSGQAVPANQVCRPGQGRIDVIKDKPPDPKNEIEWIASKFRVAPKAPAVVPAGGAPASPGVSPADQPILAGQPPSPTTGGPAVAR